MKRNVKDDMRRSLPSVDDVLSQSGIQCLLECYNREIVIQAVREVMTGIRAKIRDSIPPFDHSTVTPEIISIITVDRVNAKYAPSLRNAINATGVILHTSLGRAMLAEKAVEAVVETVRGYSTLAIDMESGKRGNRDIHTSDLICELTGAEAATTACNNAAATMLILNTLAKGKEVIVSRGQLIEIGGSFRLPEVFETSGAVMHEVGTTNKTHLHDYTGAINEHTGAILRVHQSNYGIIGFTEEPLIEELVKLGMEHRVPVIDDLGSGALIDMTEFGCAREPRVQESVRAGTTVTCFSADKLIGGPQAGIIIGRKEVIAAIKKNPLARAFRIGKMTIAALEATLKLFLNRRELICEHPTYRMLSCKPSDLEHRAQTMLRALEATGIACKAVVERGFSQMGSGSLPTESIPTALLSLQSVAISAETLARRLRHNEPPVFARIHKEVVLLDFRTIQESEDAVVLKALKKALS